MEMEVYLFLPELSLWGTDILDLHNCMICTLLFPCSRSDLRRLIVEIAMQRYLPLSITAIIDIGALRRLECGDDLAV